MSYIINQEERDRIGQELKELRQAVGLSLDAVAQRSGLGASHIHRIETGKYGVGIDVLSAIASVFGKRIELVDIE